VSQARQVGLEERICDDSHSSLKVPSPMAAFAAYQLTKIIFRSDISNLAAFATSGLNNTVETMLPI